MRPGRNAFKPGTEGERQAEKWAMQIKFGRHFIMTNDGHARVKILEDPAQRILHRKHNTRPGISGKHGVARELDGIAEPLLRINEKPLILERLLAPPERLRISARYQRFVTKIAIFVRQPPFLKAPECQQGKGAIVMCFGMVRLQLQCPVIENQRFLKAVEGAQDEAVIDVGKRIIRGNIP